MKKILIVDDLRTVVEKEKGMLGRADFRIFTAMSGKEALELHRDEKMDLIVADLDMPGMGGDELCTLVRKDNGLKKVSFIIVCTHRKEDLDRCMKCGANSYVTKPLDPEKFFERVSSFLNVPERKSFRVLIKAQIEGRFMGVPFFCTSRDISETGVLLETDKSLEVGDRLSCSFYLPTSERIIAEAEIVRKVKKGDKAGYGVKFLALPKEQKASIERFVGNSRAAFDLSGI